MKTASRVTLALAGVTTLAAIWQPFGTWWQFLATAALLLLIGAGLGGTADQRENKTKGAPAFDNSPGLPGPTTATNETGTPERIHRRNYGQKADGQ